MFGQQKPLFGQPAAPAATGSVFGQPAQQQQPATTNLFGQPQQQQQPATTGLFGQQQQPAQQQAGGLFGQQQQQPAATNPFGAPPTNAQAGGGLFGASQSNNQAGGGLFGASQTQPAPSTSNLFGGSSSNLFGAKPAGPTGLFGASTTQQQPAGTTGLFGASTTQQQPASTNNLFGASTTNNLFGNSTAAAPSTGLFGASTAAAPSTGLFWREYDAAATAAVDGIVWGVYRDESAFRRRVYKHEPAIWWRKAGTSASVRCLRLLRSFLIAFSSPQGAPAFSKSTKFNDLPDNIRSTFEQIEAHIQGRVQISKELHQRKLGEEATKGRDLIRGVHTDVINVATAIHTDLTFVQDLRGKTDSAVEDTIVATRIIDAYRNPHANMSYLKDHAGFPLEFFARVTQQMRDRLAWYKSTIEQIERKLSSSAGQAQTPQSIHATLQAQNASFLALAAKTAQLDAALQRIKQIYAQLYRTRTGSHRDPFEGDAAERQDLGLGSLRM
ncbi:hypothetical protein MKEN_00381200 [Mycena kentingensis (nom. inval.)]|nr:hypothetical protein MKEN_00381200 [Mycena kentingensis (nom. inval.)]